ncbi:MAG: sugar phosphate isomerase/epimerase [Chloroflexi bacterium]|nr:sugar phosphate isomerase/epimerase [Chloroflexota bacterium]
MRVALSTMWGIGRLGSFREFAEKAQAFGYTHIELNHQFPPAWLAEHDAGALNGLDITISSVHDPCPNAPLEGGRYPWSFQLAALDEDERRVAVAIAKGSIDLADRTGARAVVLHLGTTGWYGAEEQRLRQLWTERGPQDAEFLQMREHLVGERALRQDAAVTQARRTLRELTAYAGERGIRLGLENRQDYMELPGIEEMGTLLDEADPAVVGFWYDVGHAVLLDRLGFVPHERWLARYGPRLIGAHLHDVIGITDHRAPGVPGGTVPWDLVARSLPAAALRVLEINQHTDEALVQRAAAFLREHGVLRSP